MTFSFFPTEKITVYSAWTCFSNVISKTHMWPSRNGLDWTERYLFQETSDNNLRKLWGNLLSFSRTDENRGLEKRWFIFQDD